MEFKSGFDASPYMTSATWGKPKYKKVTDPDTSQKVYTGNGLDIHDSKKSRYKLQSESDPDVKTNGNGSKRAAVAIKRRKGSDYIPVIETRAKIIAFPVLPIKDEREFEGRNSAERIEAATQYKAALLNTNSPCSTDTPEYTYKVFRLLSSDIVEHAKQEGLTPAQFYKQFNAELYRIANDAASQTGVEREQFATYIREHAPKVADAIAGKSETPKTTPEPDSLEALQKKLSAATRRRDKAQREIDELDLQITALLAEKTVEEVRHEFYPTRVVIQPESNARGDALAGQHGTAFGHYEPTNDVTVERDGGGRVFVAPENLKPEPQPEPLRKSKKQQQREARREKRRAKRSGKRVERMVAA